VSQATKVRPARVSRVVARIAVSLPKIAMPVTNVFAAVMNIALFAIQSRRPTEFYPRRLNVADIMVAITPVAPSRI
jgi:hypothetical protein